MVGSRIQGARNMTVTVTDHYYEEDTVFHGVKTVVEEPRFFKLQFRNNKLSKEYPIPAFSYKISIPNVEEKEE